MSDENPRLVIRNPRAAHNVCFPSIGTGRIIGGLFENGKTQRRDNNFPARQEASEARERSPRTPYRTRLTN
eukprot:1186023-Prorocentrum_minimum.AAC.4